MLSVAEYTENFSYTKAITEIVKKPELLAIISIGCMFVIVQVLAIAITPTFREAKVQAFEKPEQLSNVILYLGLILIITLTILIIAKYGWKRLLRGMILFAVLVTILYVLYPILWKFIPSILINKTIYIDIPLILAFAWATVLTYYLYKFPEWYVVDTTGVVIAAGAASIFGLSFHILPAILLLIALAIYDVIAVYKTRHMLELADSVVELKLPVILVLPKKPGYSFIKQKGLKAQIEEVEKREAFFIGLGDLVIPAILTISAFRFVGSILVAYCTLLGSLIGFAVLISLVAKGKPHAGLPLLNAGALLGYFISYYLVFRNFTFGIVL
ncbi:MAG: presenilin family intramembrane aspartyl protease PSH [Candidatus Thermoplasmatota archaeon]